MKTRFPALLVAAAFASGWIWAATDTDAPSAPVVRASALKLVDRHGQVRAQLNAEGGEVVLRLRDASGAIRVKLGASDSGSGLLLLDAETVPGVHLLAGAESSITLGTGD